MLRIEDHDRTRSRQTFEHALLDDLDWLGFKPDIGATHDFRAGTTILRQSDNGDRYRAALGGLSSRGLEYGCICTRKEIAEITGDPFGAEVRYPGTCAHAGHSSAVARRVRVTDGAESFNDIRLGPQLQEPARQCGDFVIRDRNCNFTYQFCVAVDDFDQNIDLIIRGEDLLASTGRQLYLARTLGRTNAPAFLHHTLVLRPDGLKLSKSLGDTGVRELREAGESPETVLGRAAFLCGLTQAEVPLRQDDLAELFA